MYGVADILSLLRDGFPWVFGPPETMKINVVPAKAGTHCWSATDSRLRGNDVIFGGAEWRLADILAPLPRPTLRSRQPRLVSLNCPVACSFHSLIGADWCAKHALFAALEKVMSFVFSHSLALFPLFL